MKIEVYGGTKPLKGNREGLYVGGNPKEGPSPQKQGRRKVEEGEGMAHISQAGEKSNEVRTEMWPMYFMDLATRRSPDLLQKQFPELTETE